MNSSIDSGKAEPLVTIGLPVFNGENYLEEAINAVRKQTYRRLEIIISDNCSTDQTAAICQAHARQDSRIRYVRSEVNQGAAWNFNRCLELANGKYFKWLAHDDLIDPTLVEKAVAILEADSQVTICYAQVKFIDGAGEVFQDYDIKLATDSPSPTRRFRELVIKWHLCFPVFGLLRMADLEEVGPLLSFSHGDGILIEKLALRGPFHQIPEILLFSRKHDEQSMAVYGVYDESITNYNDYAVWFDPQADGKIILPSWRILWERLKVIWNAGISVREKSFLFLYVGRLILRIRRELFSDLKVASRQILSKIGRFRQANSKNVVLQSKEKDGQ